MAPKKMAKVPMRKSKSKAKAKAASTPKQAALAFNASPAPQSPDIAAGVVPNVDMGEPPIEDGPPAEPVPMNPAWRYTPHLALTPSPTNYRRRGVQGTWPPSPLVFPGDRHQSRLPYQPKSSASDWGTAMFLSPLPENELKPKDKDGKRPVAKLVKNIPGPWNSDGELLNSMPNPVASPSTKSPPTKTTMITNDDEDQGHMYKTPIRKRSPLSSIVTRLYIVCLRSLFLNVSQGSFKSFVDRESSN